MATLKSSTNRFPTHFKADRNLLVQGDRPIPNSKDTAEFARFKAQLKRAVDSVQPPQYLIDAIRKAIRS